MENPISEIHNWDWEVVPNSEEDHHSPSKSSPSSPPSRGGGVICSDYFSLDSEHNYATTTTTDAAAATLVGSEGGDEGESDNPSWVDPSGSSVVIENSGGGGGGEFSVSDNFPKSLEIVQNNGVNDVEFDSVSGSCTGEVHDELGYDKSEGEEEQKQEKNGVDDQFLGSNFEDEEDKKREENENENEKKMVVWWKVPLEVLKYCVLRVSPVWSVSMAAAALMGFVLLRRRYLYKMKRKSQGMHINVTVDDKKMSQLMSRAARLNEAFSMVKRVPVIRPALPAPGMASWPVMSLR